MPITQSMPNLGAVSSCIVAAGAMLAAEFARPTGPRGSGDKATIDTEIETYLRTALLDLWPARYVGEETGTGGDLTSRDVWLVDPHDGTRAFLQGHRGTTISVALLRDGKPVLGVVYAPLPPDRGPDLIAWAEGLPGVLRNGQPVASTLVAATLTPGSIVFLNHDSDSQPITNGKRIAPARFVALPSIAYRLARVAAGDGVAAVSLSGPCGYDYAAGHALLMGAGGVFLNEHGKPVTYARDGSSNVSRCFGGAPRAARALADRDWAASVTEKPMPRRVALAWPRPPADGALDRAIGCLMGQLIGDSLGSLVEFRDSRSIAGQYPNGVRDLADGGTWNTLAGQATDDSELALALARSLARQDSFDDEALAEAYGAWITSHPFDIGNTTRQGLGAASRAKSGKADAARKAANRTSQANGSLMRIAPIGIWASSASEAASVAALDSSLSHPNPVCLTACAAFAAAVHEGVRSGSRAAMFDVAIQIAEAADDGGVIARALRQAGDGQFPDNFQSNQGWVIVAFQNAFAHLVRGDAPEDALISTVGRGGDTDTNGAIAGALLGAAWGRDRLPARWCLPVLACRPAAALGAPQPRPAVYWPDDVPRLAEALLIRRLRQTNPATSGGESK